MEVATPETADVAVELVATVRRTRREPQRQGLDLLAAQLPAHQRQAPAVEAMARSGHQ